MNRALFLGIGFFLWLLATIVFRLAGQLFFLADNGAALAILWFLTGAGLILLALGLFRWQKLTRPQRFEAAVLLVISGMALDAFITESFATVFPNMPASFAGSFGAWLLLAYASVLLAAFLPVGLAQED